MTPTLHAPARRRALALSAAALVGALSLAGCGGDPLSGGDDKKDGDSKTVTVSSANFPESEVIGNLYAGALKAKGVEVEEKFNIGSREAYIPALEDGSIDVVPDYTGNLLSFLDEKADISSPEKIDAELPKALDAKGLTMLDKAPAEDKDSMTVTADTAKQWSLKSIGDLKAHNADLTVGAPPEFQKRSVGLPGLEKLYGVKPAKFEAISDGGGPATVKALTDGKVKAANIFTTSPAIKANGLVVLEDPKDNFPAQNVIPVMKADGASDEVKDALNAVSKQLSTDELRKLNDEVSGDAKTEPSKAAEDWLKEKGLG
ncbi:ABC transporter substrate-binding protein [Brevibacterium sp. BRM-1]|uniref:ABC transporter substrate-binding protein n=1 Tax=Brevibacterium sp. BRM-1 TaxID=2999062 RepID=UPI00228059B1|nr:ABC transporter substrate-binding protein [Brevibacterium sp. BRM-1]WAL40581.1 ABC transporter substrate-binding protein [Brevibacterium sp. BRM-1]